MNDIKFRLSEKIKQLYETTTPQEFNHLEQYFNEHPDYNKDSAIFVSEKKTTPTIET